MMTIYIRGTLRLGVHFYPPAKKATYTVDDFSYSHDLISVLFSTTLLPCRAAVSWKPWVLSPLLLTTIDQDDGQVELLIWQKPSSETIYSWGWSVRTESLWHRTELSHVYLSKSLEIPRLLLQGSDQKTVTLIQNISCQNLPCLECGKGLKNIVSCFCHDSQKPYLMLWVTFTLKDKSVAFINWILYSPPSNNRNYNS